MPEWTMQVFDLIKAIAWPVMFLCVGWWYRRYVGALTRRVASVRVKDSEFTLYPESGEWAERAELTLPARVEVELEQLDSEHGNTIRIPDSIYEGLLAVLVMHAIRTDEEDEYFSDLARQLFGALYRPEHYRGRLIPAHRMQKMGQMLTLLSELRSVADTMDEDEEGTEGERVGCVERHEAE